MSNHWIDYARESYRRREHCRRLKAAIERIPKKLVCQECGGAGGEINVVLPETGEGPWEPCGWCEGIGYVMPHIRGLWLAEKRNEGRRCVTTAKS